MLKLCRLCRACCVRYASKKKFYGRAVVYVYFPIFAPMKDKTILKVYRASAGSGKTYTLAVEYIAHLIGGRDWAEDMRRHRHILAITFTNKATAEMKERILEFLHTLSLGADDKLAEKVVETGHLPKEDLPRRAKAAMESIIHDYSHFHIHTIDTFFQRLLSSLAHELGQSASFRVDINDKEVTSEAVDALLAQLDDNEDVRLWIKDYIRQRVGESKNWRLADDIKRFAESNVLSEEFQSTNTQLREVASDNQAMKAFRQKLYAMRNAAIGELVTIAEKLHDVEILIATAGEESFQRRGDWATGFLRRIATASDIKEASPSVKEYMDNPEKLLKKGALCDSNCRAAAAAVSQALREADAIRERSLYTINSCDLTLRNLNPLRLLNEISKIIEDINTEHNRMLLAQTKLLFHEMVKGDDAPFIFEKAGTNYRNILIDEFQDTARTQWDNLRKLLLEKAASGEECLIVGDVKQSIYRWNGGDWRILKNIQHDFNYPVRTVSLDQNFRSQAAIVRFNNTFFPLAASELDAMQRMSDETEENESAASIYEDVSQKYQENKKQGYVRVTIDETKEGDFGALRTEETSEDADHTMAAQILRLHRETGLPWSEMAILVRKKEETQRILDNFSHFHKDIPLISDEAFYLSSSPAVMLLVNALRVLVDPSDEVATTYILRVYRNIVMGENRNAEELVTEKETLFPDNFLVERPTLLATPLYGLCLRLCDLFSLDDLCGREDLPSQAAFLTSFLDEIVDFLADNPPTIELFLRHWDERLVEKAIPSAEADGVRILTIHKSKGLAFHTVFVPFCHWELEDLSNATRNIEWWQPEDEAYEGLPLVPVTPIAAAANSTFARSYAQELFQRRVDNLNLAYVAFTRPKENLLIWATAKRRKDVERPATIGDILYRSMQKLYELLPQSDEGEDIALQATFSHAEDGCILQYGAPMPSGKGEAEGRSLPLTFAPHRTRATFVQSTKAKLYVGSGDPEEENVAHGLLFHRIFEEFVTADDIDRAIRELRDAGIIPHELSDEELSRYAHRRIDGDGTLPEVREWFDGSWRVRRESTLLTRQSSGELKALRPDRVMQRNGRVVVVDYKFAVPCDAHHRQVRSYMNALVQMGVRNVEGFLWYVDRNEIERVRL